MILIRMRLKKMHENWSKNPKNNFGMKATADEMDVATELCFGEKRNEREC